MIPVKKIYQVGEKMSERGALTSENMAIAVKKTTLEKLKAIGTRKNIGMLVFIENIIHQKVYEL
jgi:hypothetical protein